MPDTITGTGGGGFTRDYAIGNVNDWAKQTYGRTGTQDEWNRMSNYFPTSQTTYTQGDIDRAKGLVGSWYGTPTTIDPGGVGRGTTTGLSRDDAIRQMNDWAKQTYGRYGTEAEWNRLAGYFPGQTTFSQADLDRAKGIVGGWFTTPGTTTPPGPTTGGTTTGGTTTTSTLNSTAAPGFTAPRPDLPGYTAPDPFKYDPFKAPTWAEMQAADPGIQARLARGQQAIEHSAAAKGNLGSPNTMAGLIDYNQQAAADEFANAYNRSFGQWQTGYNTAADTYDRNYGVSSDTFQRNYQRAMDQYNAEFAGRQLEYAPELLTWQQQNRMGELGFDRAWQEYLYNRDDAFRRESRDQQRYDTRDFYERDDLWRRYQLEEQRRQFLASLGTT